MMLPIKLAYGLPFITVSISSNGMTTVIENVLLDTGSAATIFRIDDLEPLGIFVQLTDEIQFMRGVGGREPVVEKKVDILTAGDLVAHALTVQIGAVDYGFAINGILGLDFLLQTGAIIDLGTMEIRKGG